MTEPASPSTPLSRHDVVVVGAGPAGLAAAETLATAGRPPVIYDAMPSPARKFLLAGRGGLNLTHSEPLERFVTRYGEAREALLPAVSAFTPADLTAWCEGLGQPVFTGTSGRVFPVAMKASPLLRAWLRRLDAAGVRIVPRRRWTGVTEDGDLVFTTPEGARETVAARAVILALGGASWPRLGSDGAWTAPVSAMGVPVTPLEPANAGVRIAWSEHLRTRHAGEPLKRIALTLGPHRVRGEAIVTEGGLEGGAVYALGPAIRTSLMAGPTLLGLDLRPDLDHAALEARLSRPRGGASASNFLRKAAQLSPVGLSVLRDGAGGPPPTSAAELAALIKAVPLTILGFTPIERAISSAGGVPFDALTPDLELRARPGWFAAGEMLDWEAPTGGYLLQACFATGITAAKGALARLAQPQSSKI